MFGNIAVSNLIPAVDVILIRLSVRLTVAVNALPISPLSPFPPGGILPSYICPIAEWRGNFHFSGYSPLFFPFLAHFWFILFLLRRRKPRYRFFFPSLFWLQVPLAQSPLLFLLLSSLGSKSLHSPSEGRDKKGKPLKTTLSFPLCMPRTKKNKRINCYSRLGKD